MEYILVSNLADLTLWDEGLIDRRCLSFCLKDSQCSPRGFLSENGVELICFYSGEIAIYRPETLAVLDTYRRARINERCQPGSSYFVETDDIFKDFTKWYKRKYL